MKAIMQQIDDTVRDYNRLKHSYPVITPEEWEQATLSQQHSAVIMQAHIRYDGPQTLYSLIANKIPKHPAYISLEGRDAFRFATSPTGPMCMAGRRVFHWIGIANDWQNNTGIKLLDTTLEQAQKSIQLREAYYEGTHYVPVFNNTNCYVLNSSPEFHEIPLTQELWDDFLLTYAAQLSKLPAMSLGLCGDPRSIFHI